MFCCAITSAQCAFPDTIKPVARVRQPFTIRLDSLTGSFALTASMLDSLSSDNCTPHDSLTFRLIELYGGFQSNSSQAQISLTDTSIQWCIGLKLFRLFVQDKAGKFSYKDIFLYVESDYPLSTQCINEPPNEEVNIGGSIKTEVGQTLDAAITINQWGYLNPFAALVNKNVYFYSLPKGTDYYIEANKKNNPKNGISTFDLVLMQKHILGIQLLNSPYKQIAADVNNSKTITTADMVYLRKMILGIEDMFANGQSWEFVPTKFVFTDPTKPLLSFSNVNSRISILNVQKDTFGLDFIAIKKGDLNNSAVTLVTPKAAPRLATPYLLETPNLSFETNERIEIPITALSHERIEGYQGTFNYDTKALELLEIVGENDNFNTSNEGKITFSEIRQPNEKEVLFTLIFKSKQRGNLTQALHFSDDITASEVYDLEGEAHPLALTYQKDATAQETFTLFPNPAHDVVTVLFAKRNEPTQLTICNSLGKIIYSTSIFEPSENINVSDYPNGVYFCTMQQDGKEEVRRLVIAR
jgi:hypothetical protein